MNLSFPTTNVRELNRQSTTIRRALVEEAIAFTSSNDIENKRYTTLYTHDNYDIKVGKPGKEFGLNRIKYKNGERGNNPNDMAPTVFRDNQIVERDGSFIQIFKQFIHIYENPEALKILACLCVRNAYTLDHIQNGNGNWRYAPPAIAIQRLSELMPADFSEPVEVFLNYIETIAVNEDVKYSTLGYNPNLSNAIGRRNNLLTYAHLIYIILRKAELGETDFLIEFISFSGRLMSPPTGVNPISLATAFDFFTALRPATASQ